MRQKGCTSAVIIAIASTIVLLVIVNILLYKPRLKEFPAYYRGYNQQLYYKTSGEPSYYAPVKGVKANELKLLYRIPGCENTYCSEPEILGTDKYVIFAWYVFPDLNTAKISFVNAFADYLKDDKFVYYRHYEDTVPTIWKITDADPSSFSEFAGDLYQDKNNIYYRGVIVPNIDRSTFKFIKQPDGSMKESDKNGYISLPDPNEVQKYPEIKHL